MLNKILLWIVLVFVASFLLLSAESVLTQKALAEKTLRLHVVANSDDPKDQEQKLRLRDHILKEIQYLTLGCSDLEDTENAILSALPVLQDSAKQYLVKEGSQHDVSVRLCRESFSTRDYTSFSLPAGEYHSLRIVIGEGEGRNWWCVVFPTLCSAATIEELEAAAEYGGYEFEEVQFIQKKEPKYKLQFKLLEWVKGVFH